MHDQRRVGALEVTGLGSRESVVEELCERRGVGARIELASGPGLGRERGGRWLGREGRDDGFIRHTAFYANDGQMSSVDGAVQLRLSLGSSRGTRSW